MTKPKQSFSSQKDFMIPEIWMIGFADLQV